MRLSISERQFAFVEGELAKERAHALRKVGDRLDDAAARCSELLARLDGFDGVPDPQDGAGATADAPPAPAPGSAPVAPVDRAPLLEDYRAARLAFQEAKAWLCLQREAIGLHEHRWVDRLYPDPPRR
ncbi:MAG: hypothetical protein U0Q07_04675 [Acidimicrobiales bacterium]